MSEKTLIKTMKVSKPKTRAATKPVTDAEHQTVIDTIRGRTLEMSFTVHGLPKSRAIGGKLAEQVAASVQGKKKGVRSRWSMFTSEHPQVKALNAAIRDLETLRDSWTIVKSAEVKRGDGDKVSIAGGKRLIWDKDVTDFHSLFVKAAKKIDAEVDKLQHAMDHSTLDADDNPIKSVKDMDRENAGEAWDESVYPKDLRLVVGVSKERDGAGNPRIGQDGDPIYVINFAEYHVSEKLPTLLRERAIARIDAGISHTVETAMGHAVGQLAEDMMTFLGELSNRMKVYPRPTSPYAYVTRHGEAEIVKMVDHEADKSVPAGHVKGLVRYKEVVGDGDEQSEQKVSKWFGPMKESEFYDRFQPQSSGERKKIYPSVIEGIINDLQTFRDKKSKMLGAYGENLVAAFEPLLDTLTKAKQSNPYISNTSAAQKLAAALKTDEEVRQSVAKVVTDTVEALEDQVQTVKATVARRRSIKTSLISKLGDDD